MDDTECTLTGSPYPAPRLLDVLFSTISICLIQSCRRNSCVQPVDEVINSQAGYKRKQLAGDKLGCYLMVPPPMGVTNMPFTGDAIRILLRNF